ncbi:MAG TPA: electron transport complex subunit RsxG [Marinobacter sp.]|nr:electron transport complex subunit RsxG [Marinobacter sp.]
MTTLARSIRKSAIGLGLFAVVTGGVIAVTQAFTKDRIQEQIARAEASALLEIIPEQTHDNNLLKDTVQLPTSIALANNEPVTVWVTRLGEQPTGFIMPIVAPDGYSGDIRLLVGLNTEGDVLGVRVTSHRETPGLGDRIELKKSDWVLSFDGRSLGEPPYQAWNVKKDGGQFDQFTGATITPRAIVRAVQKALIYFHKNREEILKRLNEPPLLQNAPLASAIITSGLVHSEYS